MESSTGEIVAGAHAGTATTVDGVIRVARTTRPARLAAGAAAALAALLVPAGASAAPYTAEPGPARADARFAVSYEGTGRWHTRFHATPPNDGGKPDKNDARDSSRQAWKVRFRRGIMFPTCGRPADGGSDPCMGVTGLNGARGATSVSGRVDHRHVDGLYRQLDRTVKCRLAMRTSKRRNVMGALRVRYVPESDSFGITAHNPVATALSNFPAQCRKQGDSIDRILDFYALPGFSFADGFGPDRWFESGEVVVPAQLFHSSQKISIRLADTPAGTPPRRCAVRDPSFERCKTGGSWAGVLTFKAKPATATARSSRVTAARAKRPRGTYTGRGGRYLLSVSGRTIDLAAFDFDCGTATGRTSLNDIPIRKRRGRYRFSIKAHGNVTYSDDHVDENAAVTASGVFSVTGRRVAGTLRVKTPRCGGTGKVDWAARR